MVRELRTLAERAAVHRHKRHDIRGADARMHAVLPGEVDEVRRPPRCAHRRLAHGLRRPGDRDHAAIVRRVHRPIEQADTIYLHAAHDLAHYTFIAAL